MHLLVCRPKPKVLNPSVNSATCAPNQHANPPLFLKKEAKRRNAAVEDLKGELRSPFK